MDKELFREMLKEFLKENDVYSVFEEGKLEKFLDNDKSKDNETAPSDF